MTSGNKMKKKKAKKKSDSFYSTFIGEFVQVIGEFTTQDKGGTYATITGYILDVDKDYLYLGPTADAVSAAIARNKVFSIQIITDEDRHAEMLDNLQPPKDKNDGN